MQHQRVDITVHAENAAVAKAGGAKDKPWCQTLQEFELSFIVGGFYLPHIGHPFPNIEDDQQAEQSHKDERYSPGKVVAQGGAEGNAQQVGNSHAGNHNAHRPRLVVFVSQAHGGNGTYTEVGSMRKSRDKAGYQEHIEVGGDGAE